MPWQGDLFCGQLVKTSGEAEDVYSHLGITPSSDDVFDGSGREFEITHKGEAVKVYVCAMYDNESGERAVAFSLTGRYQGRVLDHSFKDGRPDPFVFDPMDLVEILFQVRKWWREAQVFVWDRHY